MKPIHSGSRSSQGKLMLINLISSMDTISDICMDKKVRKMIIRPGPVPKSLGRQLQDKMNSTDVHLRLFQRTTWGSSYLPMALRMKKWNLFWIKEEKIYTKWPVWDSMKLYIQVVLLMELVTILMDSSLLQFNIWRMWKKIKRINNSSMNLQMQLNRIRIILRVIWVISQQEMQVLKVWKWTEEEEL